VGGTHRLLIAMYVEVNVGRKQSYLNDVANKRL
jgi:hypothetical protein